MTRRILRRKKARIREGDKMTRTDGTQENGQIQELTIEETFAKLDETISLLQKQDTALEDAFRAYQEGMKLVKDCSAKIDLVEKKVMMLNEEGGLDEF